MSFQQPPYKKPNQSAQTPPPAGQNPADGLDPAAIIAARSAAVARNRQKSERAALLRDAMRIVGVIVLVIGVGVIWYFKHQGTLKEQERQARIAEEERKARAKENEERAAKTEARNKERMEKKKAEEDKKRKAEEERRRVEDEKKKAERIKKDNIERYNRALRRFRGATLDLYAVVPEADRPESVVNERCFSCILPGGQMGVVLYEINSLPGKTMKITRLDSNGTAADVSLAEFNAVSSKTPFLLSTGTRCYYRPVSGSRWERRIPVPAANQTLELARQDFRDMFDIVRKYGIRDSAIQYEVYFAESGVPEKRILVVPFGGSLRRSDVKSVLESSHHGGVDVETRMNGGQLIIRRKGGAR